MPASRNRSRRRKSIVGVNSVQRQLYKAQLMITSKHRLCNIDIDLVRLMAFIMSVFVESLPLYFGVTVCIQSIGSVLTSILRI